MGRKEKAAFPCEVKYGGTMTPDDLEIIAEIIARWILERERKRVTESATPRA